MHVHTTTHDGLRLHVDVDGPPDADVTLVLAHCWVLTREAWNYQLRDLRRHFGERVRVIAYDHRGHGRSERTRYRDATLINLARDLHAVISDHAPTGELVLAGHSIGGMTVMTFAREFPHVVRDRVKAVALVNTSAGDLDTVTLGLPEAGKLVRAQIPLVLALRSKMYTVSARMRTPTIESFVVRRFVFGTPMRLRDHAQTVEGVINSPPATMRGFYDSMMDHDVYDALPVLSGRPVKVLVGERDLLTPLSHARRIADGIDGAVLTVANGAGHMLPFEREELVTGALCDLVEGVLARQPAP
ncbi:alpha/beta hydrolase [Nocardioidaceae bacterium]|nr:alpha/beta hydrolase [Nocardioidaceae bacterium]